MPDIFAAVTINNVRSLNYLSGQTAHAKRLGPNIELRPGAVPCTQLNWSIHDDDPRDYRAAYKKHRDSTGARERKGAQIGLHLLMIVSPEWLSAAGDMHDPDNPRVVALFNTAKDSAERRFGGVYAVRMDLDEIGSGCVDVFCAPVHLRPGRRKKDGTHGEGTLEISPRKSLKALQQQYETKKEYVAVQSAWADDMQVLDPTIKRGESKQDTGREHRDTPEFKAFKDAQAAALEATKAAEAKTALLLAEAHEATQRTSRARADAERLRGEMDALRRDDEERRRRAQTAEAEAADRQQRLRDEASQLAVRAAALRAEANCLVADAARVQARENELVQWQQRNENETKNLAEQRAAAQERLCAIDERDRRTSSQEKACAGRIEALARAEAELVRKQQSAEVLLQDARRKAARLLQVEQERDAARKEVEGRDRAFSLLYDGIIRIQKGELTTRRALEEDESLKHIVGYLAPIIATLGMVQRHEREQAVGRVEKAERAAIEATERAVEAERKESTSAGKIEALGSSLEGLVGLLSKYKLGRELSEQVVAAQTVITKLFGRKPSSLIQPQGKTGGNGLG